MTRERYIRLFAGTFVMGSLALGFWVNQYWYLYIAAMRFVLPKLGVPT